MMALILVLAYAITAIVEINSLAKKKYWRDLAVFSAFMTISFIVSMLFCLGVQLPNPVDALHHLFEWLGLHY